MPAGEKNFLNSILSLLLGVIIFAGLCSAQAFANDKSIDKSRITDDLIPLQIESIPRRPRPILELGPSFLAPGPIGAGFKLPTGAVWQPSLMIWGTNRTAFQTFDNSERDLTEWVQRFDLYANLYLTFTERILFGVRPFDKSGRFTRYTLNDSDNSPKSEDGDFDDELNFNITTLFFEGDFGELFPFLDEKDSRGLDIGIAVGRQAINFQDGVLVNDSLDALGLSKINLKPSWAVNYRVTALWAWDEVNRTNLGIEDNTASLFGIFNEIDLRASTLEFDLIFLDADAETGDGFYGGVGATQRFANYNTTFRLLGSAPVGNETEHNQDGGLFIAEISTTPHASNDFVYLSSFWAFNNFRSASRDPSAGGPLGAVGVLFAAPGLGRYQAALDSSSNDVFGGALGYQLFFNDSRQQLLFELGARWANKNIGQRAVGFGPSFQTAIGSRTVIRIDVYAAYGSKRLAEQNSKEDFRYGSRLEWLLRL